MVHEKVKASLDFLSFERPCCMEMGRKLALLAVKIVLSVMDSYKTRLFGLGLQHILRDDHEKARHHEIEYARIGHTHVS